MRVVNFKRRLNENFEVIYSDGVKQGKKFVNLNKAKSWAINLIKSKLDSKFPIRDLEIFKDATGFHSTTQEEYLINYYGEGSYYDNISKENPKILAKKLEIS